MRNARERRTTRVRGQDQEPTYQRRRAQPSCVAPWLSIAVAVAGWQRGTRHVNKSEAQIKKITESHMTLAGHFKGLGSGRDFNMLDEATNVNLIENNE